MSMIRREGILLAVLGLAVLAAYAQTLLAFHSRWASMELGYSHGYPVLLIMLYVIFERRRQLAQLPQRPFPAALPLLALFSALWLLANAVQVQIVQQLLLPAIVLAWLGAICGVRLLLALVVPVLLIYLAVPVWDVLVYPLRLLTVIVVQALLELGNYTAYVDGFHITVPAGKFRVAGGCSGLNYFLTAMTLAVVYAVLYIGQPLRRLLFAIVCLLTALLVNWLRVFLLVLIGYHTDMQSSLIADHGTFGWVLFALALIPLFWFGARLEVADHRAETPDGSACPRDNVFSRRVALLSTVVAVSGPLTAYALQQRAAANPFSFQSPQLVDFQIRESDAAPWWLEYRGFDRAGLWRYGASDSEVHLRALYYDVQTQGKELVSDINRIIDERHVREASPVSLDAVASTLQEMVVSINGKPQLVWWFYYIAGEVHVDPGKAKLAQLRGLLRGDMSAALVVLDVPCTGFNARCEVQRGLLAAIAPVAIRGMAGSDTAPSGQPRGEL